MFDDAITSVNEHVLPAAKGMSGFKGFLGLADRSTGKVVTVTLWESEEAMKQSEQAADQIRNDSAIAAAAEILAVERFEVVIDLPV